MRKPASLPNQHLQLHVAKNPEVILVLNKKGRKVRKKYARKEGSSPSGIPA